MPQSVGSKLHSFWNQHSDHCGLILTTNKLSAISGPMASRMTPLKVDCPPPSCLLQKAQTYLQSCGKNYSNQQVLDVLTKAGADMRKRIEAIDEM